MPGLCRWLRWAKSPAFSGISCREGRSPRDIVMWWGSCEHSPTPDAIETPYECGFILKKENLPVCERWWSAHFSPDRPTLPLWSAESLGRPTEDLLHRSETKPGSACWPRSCASGGPSRTLALKVKLKTGNLSHCPLQSGCIQRKKKMFLLLQSSVHSGCSVINNCFTTIYQTVLVQPSFSHLTEPSHAPQGMNSFQQFLKRKFKHVTFSSYLSPHRGSSHTCHHSHCTAIHEMGTRGSFPSPVLPQPGWHPGERSRRPARGPPHPRRETLPPAHLRSFITAESDF